MVTTRGQELQQVWPWTGILCCNKVFYVATEFGQGQGISCRNREFLCHDRVSWSGVATKYFMSQQSLVKTKSFLIATELAKVKRFYVARIRCHDRVAKKICVATKFILHRNREF